METESREYWEGLVNEINELRTRLNGKPQEFKIGYSLSSGGILNAYREGDLSFDDAVKKLNELSAHSGEGADMGKLQLEIGDWQDEAFPAATALSKVSHLAKEVIELKKALVAPATETEIAEELADCQHLIFGIASKSGINLYDATRRKFEVNKKRKWGKPDGNGVVEHLSSPQVSKGKG